MTLSPDDTSILHVPLPYMTITIGGTTVTTDAEGAFVAELSGSSFSSGANANQTNILDGVTVAYEGNEIVTIDSNALETNEEKREQIAQNDDGKYEITIERTYQDLFDAMDNMGQAMARAQSEYRPTYFGISAAMIAAAGANGYSFPPGSNRLYTADGIIGCNKCYQSFFTADDTSKLMPYSDCWNSILFGISHALDPNENFVYYMSLNCFIEAILTNEGSNETNIYCNGTLKTDGHYNCSWFFGINHSERFHIEDGSDLVYYYHNPEIR